MLRPVTASSVVAKNRSVRQVSRWREGGERSDFIGRGGGGGCEFRMRRETSFSSRLETMAFRLNKCSGEFVTVRSSQAGGPRFAKLGGSSAASWGGLEILGVGLPLCLSGLLPICYKKLSN